MNSLILLLGLVAIAIPGMLMLALRRARQAGVRCENLELLNLDLAVRLGDIEKRISQLARSGRETGERLDRLAAEQGRLTPGASRTGFGEAIALIEHGASAEQLVDTCGISRAEARLVETLYGKNESAAAPLPNKFALVNTHFEMSENRSRKLTGITTRN